MMSCNNNVVASHFHNNIGPTFKVQQLLEYNNSCPTLR